MSPLPTYERAANPPPMQLTDRDERLLETIHSFDGLLAVSHIRDLLFEGVAPRTLRTRLSLLYHNGYLSRPNEERQKRLKQVVYWLGPKGAQLVSEVVGRSLKETPPDWKNIKHELQVCDVRVAVIKAAKKLSGGELEVWWPASEFVAQPDTVDYQIAGKHASRKILPDGYCVIVGPAKTGQLGRRRLFLELDRSTEDNPRFVREKIIPVVNYVRSEQYRLRFGQGGRWVIVTTSDRRIASMRKQALAAVGDTSRLFYFTTFEEATRQNILTSPIWTEPTTEEKFALFGPLARE